MRPRVVPLCPAPPAWGYKGALEPSGSSHGPAWALSVSPSAYLPGLSTRALGSLQGVELHHFLGARLDVGGEIAGAVFPLDLGVGAGLAVGAL
jgi:hypothetical protein